MSEAAIPSDRALRDAALRVLADNRRGDATVPSPGLYPHQWLWDSAFVAMGLAAHDPGAAAAELLSLRRGQWDNGMLPHIIFSDTPDYWEGPDFWRSREVTGSPSGVDASAITQPPVVTIAAETVAGRLPAEEGRHFLESVYPMLLRYHAWIYRERVRSSGLAVIVHPWETGLDNSPPWMELMKRAPGAPVGMFLERVGLGRLNTKRRGDTRKVPLEERQTNVETLRTKALAERYRSWGYDSGVILARSKVVVESVDFNSILVRANRALDAIAEALDRRLSDDLAAAMQKTERALESLWDDESEEYFSRDFRTQAPMRTSSVVTFMPLYAGTCSAERARSLVAKLNDPRRYATPYPVPSAPLDSPYFSDRRYWQGPTWMNMNHFIAEGLRGAGYLDEAATIERSTVDLVRRSGFREYYSPLTGEGLGAGDFSWTAALVLEHLAE